MLKQNNPGFLAEEIANLKALCAAENKSFIVGCVFDIFTNLSH